MDDKKYIKEEYKEKIYLKKINHKLPIKDLKFYNKIFLIIPIINRNVEIFLIIPNNYLIIANNS